MDLERGIRIMGNCNCCHGDKLDKQDQFILNWSDVTAEAEFTCSFEVKYDQNQIYNNWTNCNCSKDDATQYVRPYGRVAIVVDPLWNYEPYLVTRTLITFFERFHNRMNLEVVYGGSPRSDYDVEHIAHMYGVDYKNMCSSPIIRDFRDHTEVKYSVDRFIDNMINFHPFSNSTNINRVIIFADCNASYRANSIYPIIRFCKNNNISCIIIHSDGQYDEVNKVFYEDIDKNGNRIIPGSNFHTPYTTNMIYECNSYNQPTNYVYGRKYPKECDCCCDNTTGNICRPPRVPNLYDYESRDSGWRGEYYGGPFHNHRKHSYLNYDQEDIDDSYCDPCGRLYHTGKIID